MSEANHSLPPNHFHAMSRADWRAWLTDHHTQLGGIWLVRYKKAVGKPTLTYHDIVQEALCFGWIDSLPRKLDAERTMLYVAPRKPGSGWSRVNKAHIERMVAQGLMTPAGQAKIDAAQADGSWTALDAIENLEVPDDLAAAFDGYPGAAAYWDAFPRSVKRGILEWIASAKRPPTRAKRIDETARLAQQGERANQWRGRKKR